MRTVGADFENVALEFFHRRGIEPSRRFPIMLGLRTKKIHCFDLGSAERKMN
jgi:hypothetical protein